MREVAGIVYTDRHGVTCVADVVAMQVVSVCERGSMRTDRIILWGLLGIAIIAVLAAVIASQLGATDVVGVVVVAGALCVTVIVAGLPGYIARQNNHQYATAVSVLGVLGIFTFGILWIVALVWALAVPKDAKAKAAPDGPGSFRVAGVDRDSKYETSIVVEASNTANARAMGEVRGIHVTEVKRITE
jgi:hypothetical protein